MRKKGASSTIMILIWIALGIAILFIFYGAISKAYENWKVNYLDCKGTCKNACDSGEDLISKTCYVKGEKKEGVCCATLDSLLSKNNNTSAQNGAGINSNSGNSNSQANSGNSNQGGNAPGSSLPPVIEVRKGQNSVEKISGSSTQNIQAEQSYKYIIWVENQQGISCTVTMLSASSGQPTTDQGMAVDTTASCSGSFESGYMSADLNPLSAQIGQSYKLQIIAKNATATVASAIINFVVTQ